MRAFVNGFPKHGTHAAAKACELLGVPIVHGHWPTGQLPEATHHVFIKRDPRNGLVSWLRAHGDPLTQGMLIKNIRRFGNASLSEELKLFSGWLKDGAFVLKFEDLIASDAEMRRLAKYLGVPYLDDAFPNLPSHTRTWTGKYSDYKTVWTPRVESVWRECGGVKILHDWGYA